MIIKFRKYNESNPYYKFEHGDVVICIKDTRLHGFDLPIKIGEKKIVRGCSSTGVWFMDTPGGYGSYPIYDFELYVPDKIKEEDIEWF